LHCAVLGTAFAGVIGPRDHDADLNAARGDLGVFLFETDGKTSRAMIGWYAPMGPVSHYEFLSRHGIEEAIPWAMLKGNDDGMMSIRHDRAEAAGLRYHPLAVTVRDTMAWWGTVPETRRGSPRFTISPAKEAEALAA
jgi:hypothetical protein